MIHHEYQELIFHTNTAPTANQVREPRSGAGERAAIYDGRHYKARKNEKVQCLCSEYMPGLVTKGEGRLDTEAQDDTPDGYGYDVVDKSDCLSIAAKTKHLHRTLAPVLNRLADYLKNKDTVIVLQGSHIFP